MSKIFCFVISTLLVLNISESLPATTKDPIADYHGIFQTQHNETSDSTNRELPTQTAIANETIESKTDDSNKHIEAKHPVTEQDAQNIENKSEIDKVTFEMVKLKCQHLQNLLRQNKTSVNTNRPPGIQYSTTRPFYITPKPVYKPSYTSISRPNGFYITAQSTTTRRPVVNVQTAPPVKYIRLEPVILQKTILSDGRTVYYWHRSLPTAVEYPSKLPTEIPSNNVQNEFVPPYGYVPQNINVPAPSSAHFAPSNSYYYYPTIDQSSNLDSKPAEITTEASTTTTTTTTTEGSYGYGFGSFLPFYSLTKDESTSSTTSQPTTTTPPTTTSPATNPSTDKVVANDLVYAQQLKFIVPVPYEGSQGRFQSQAPWSFDPYAYYPKEFQPDTVNVRVPYSPTFHMIRAVAVPKMDGNVSDRVDQTDVNA